MHGNLVYDKNAILNHQEKDEYFNKLCWDHSVNIWEKKKLHAYLAPYVRINSKQVRALYIKFETI